MRRLGWALGLGLLAAGGALVEACGADSDAPDTTPDASIPDGMAQAPDGATHDDGAVTTPPPDSGPIDDAGASDTGAPDTYAPPPPLTLGATCAIDADAGDAGATGNCASGYCVDGVCCATACDGVCERCDLPDAGGTCTPIAAGSDPDVECLGAGADAGADSGATTCAGACDGAGSCSFPETPCGAEAKCAAQVSNHEQCIQGACVPVSQDCSLNGFCDATSGLCAGLEDAGVACTNADQCATNLCINAHCCATSCSAPSSCTTGACLCNGTACTAGAACISWYVDADGDGYGAPSSGPTAISCANVTPPDYNGKHYQPASKLDCYDANANAYPGSYYSSATNRGDGSWDYNCDGSSTPVYTNNVTGQACTACSVKTPFNCNDTCFAACGTTCEGEASASFGFNCATCVELNSVVTQGWTGTTPGCGQTGTFASCSGTYYSAGHCTPAPSSTSMQQPCR